MKICLIVEERKIERGRYFNKCELAYISKYHPNLYENAKNSRIKVVLENERKSQELKQKQEEKRIVKEV